MKRSPLRAIPAVEKVMQALGETGLPRRLVLDVVRGELQSLRSEKRIPAADEVLTRIRSALDDLRASRIRPLINATGILVHTNFGRAPLAAGAIEAVAAIAASYSNLEYSVPTGSRGHRAAYLERGLAVLCGAEAATVVNNNAASLVLILNHFCRPGKAQVVISRGELVQIGGGFRIPDVLESSGATLREIGTTNQTALRDYSRALTRETALILKVHRSNFFMGGFVESPRTDEIAALAQARRVPFVEDLGSGAMIDTAAIDALEHEPTPAEVLGKGVDLVCFSGDKLLGGPQAGIIAGRAKLVTALKRAPLFRALRCDKLILSALEATVDRYLAGGIGSGREACAIPVVDMMKTSERELRARAEAIGAALSGSPVQARVGTGEAQIGGGTLPKSVLPSVTVDLVHRALAPQQLAARLREHSTPVIGYVSRGTVKLDLRTVFAHQDQEVVAAIRAACSR